MKFVCVDNVERRGWTSTHDVSNFLTIGKTYYGVLSPDRPLIKVYNDKGHWSIHEQGLFQPEEVSKIKKEQ